MLETLRGDQECGGQDMRLEIISIVEQITIYKDNLSKNGTKNLNVHYKKCAMNPSSKSNQSRSQLVFLRM